MRDSIRSDHERSTLGYGVVIFLSAFLLFEVQLILGKYFLPWFGGTPAMWVTCMFFFQVLLVVGYTYAHGFASYLTPRVQGSVHLFVLLVSLALLGLLAIHWHAPLLPDLSWRGHNSVHPAWRLIALLSVSAGLPYFVLSSTGPLLQSWFAQTHPGQSPYRLYALSNLGSLLALFSYPFLIEPWLPLRTQARLWGWGFFAYALFCGYRAVKLTNWRGIHTPEAETRSNDSNQVVTADQPGFGAYILWLSLAACASVMFLATTNQICQDIAVIPFLWVLPLGLYLLSFIICFDHSRWYSRRIFHPAFAVAVLLSCLVLKGWGLKNIRLQIAVYCLTLFVSCMICHGELARSKPAARHLTSYYLVIALGGALGGIFVALIAPHVFQAFWEYHVGLWGAALLSFVVLARDRSSWLQSSQFGLPAVALAAAVLPGITGLVTEGKKGFGNMFPILPLLVALYVLTRWGDKGENQARRAAVPIYCATALLILGGTLAFMARGQVRGAVWKSRNFYGLLVVREQSFSDPDWHAYTLQHGRTAHGFQFRGPNRTTPTSYYGFTSGAGRALLALRSARRGDAAGLRIGVVGLGAGTLAAYGRSRDYIRFYEINPEVVRVATDEKYFTYLKDCPARWDVITGDARLSMESELAQKQGQDFDLLAIDAFSGDAIPVHLLSEEAFQIYLKELKPAGVLAVHITNGYIDLRPVVARLAQRAGLKYELIHTDGDQVTTSYSDWVLLSSDGQFLNSLLTTGEGTAGGPPQATVSLWTDDYSNLFQVLKK